MINYLCTSPKPALNGTDALYNEIELLKSSFGGKIHSLFPFKKPISKFPAFLYGMHNFYKIKSSAVSNKINHIFAPSLVYLPVINCLPKPIIFNIVASINKQSKLLPKSFIKKIDALVVSNSRDAHYLKSKNYENVVVVKTGINVAPFEKHQTPVNDSFNILMASAPWEKKQLTTKGIHLLLSALRQTEKIKLTLLWRNVLVNEIEGLIRNYGVSDKVTLINKKANVPELLKTVNATVLLCNDTSVVKAYPHSLIESLISGKPVIVSSQIAMADFVKQNNCGIVLDNFDTSNFIECINKLQAEYNQFSNATAAIDSNMFSNKRMLNDYKKLYAALFAKCEQTFNGTYRYSTA